MTPVSEAKTQEWARTIAATLKAHDPANGIYENSPAALALADLYAELTASRARLAELELERDGLREALEGRPRSEQRCHIFHISTHKTCLTERSDFRCWPCEVESRLAPTDMKEQ